MNETANLLMSSRVRDRCRVGPHFARAASPGGRILRALGRWYPGEQLPRWDVLDNQLYLGTNCMFRGDNIKQKSGFRLERCHAHGFVMKSEAESLALPDKLTKSELVFL